MIYCECECMSKNIFGFCTKAEVMIGPSGCASYFPNTNTVCKQVISHFGIDAQHEKTVEELTELADAIMGHGSILEETADVLNMIEQIKIIHSITNEQLGVMMKFKMDRTLEKIQSKE